VELEDIGLEGDLAAPREEMHVVAPQGRAAVAQDLRGEKDAQSAAWGPGLAPSASRGQEPGESTPGGRGGALCGAARRAGSAGGRTM